jgi:hypothetical protein
MNKNNTQKGSVIIINTILFFVLSSVIIFAIATPVVSSFELTKSFLKSKQAFMVAASASNEALYKLKTNKDLANAESVSLAQGKATISVADTVSGKQISINSDVDSYERNFKINIEEDDGVGFNYGIQIGQGGFELNGNSGIIGNIYSNGDVIGTGGPYVTGSAIAANISDPITVATNNSGTIDPPHQISFGSNTTPQDFAQSFSINTTDPVSSVRILIRKSGTAWMNNITLRITSNNGGKPDKTTLAQATISASTVGSSFGYLTVPLNSAVSLTPGATYWLVFDTSTTWGQHYILGANEGQYTNGASQLGSWASNNGGTWSETSPASLDTYFDINVGGSTGLIRGLAVGSSGQGDAWAYEVKDSTVAGVIYCQGGSGNNKQCDTSRPNPIQQAWPISDGNIQDWKNIAIAGGTIESLSLGSQDTASIGPTYINGNLSVGAGGVLNLNGTVYVKGNISVSGGGIIRINPTLGNQSVVIVTDGRISTGGGGQFQGSGASGSYILVATTSTCPVGAGCSNNPAISVSGGTGAVVLNAQKGTIEFDGGAQARQATGHKIIMSGGTTVTYESGLQNPNFTSGPSGSWKIKSWKEVE